jgi:hypothetical protein
MSLALASCAMLEHMKNIQVIDGAANAVYDIFAATAEEFALIFQLTRISHFLTKMGAWPEEGA